MIQIQKLTLTNNSVASDGEDYSTSSKQATKTIDENYLPEFWIIRGDDKDIETRYFRPNDLLTLVIRNTGDWRTTQVTITDEIGLGRYSAFSSGNYHVLTTRLQNPKSYGEWLIFVEGPLKEQDKIFQINLVFHIDESIPDDADERRIKLEALEDDIQISYSSEPELTDHRLYNLKEMRKDISYLNNDLSVLKIPINEISGIGPTYKKRLESKNINYVHEIIQYQTSDLSDIVEASEEQCLTWVEEAESIANDPKNEIYKEYKSTTSLIDE